MVRSTHIRCKRRVDGAATVLRGGRLVDQGRVVRDHDDVGTGLLALDGGYLVPQPRAVACVGGVVLGHGPTVNLGEVAHQPRDDGTRRFVGDV